MYLWKPLGFIHISSLPNSQNWAIISTQDGTATAEERSRQLEIRRERHRRDCEKKGFDALQKEKKKKNWTHICLGLHKWMLTEVIRQDLGLLQENYIAVHQWINQVILKTHLSWIQWWTVYTDIVLFNLNQLELQPYSSCDKFFNYKILERSRVSGTKENDQGK